MRPVITADACKTVVDEASARTVGVPGARGTKRAVHFVEAVEIFHLMDEKMAWEDDGKVPPERQKKAYAMLVSAAKKCFPKADQKEILGRLGLSYELVQLLRDGQPMPQETVSVELLKKLFKQLREDVIAEEIKAG